MKPAPRSAKLARRTLLATLLVAVAGIAAGVPGDAQAAPPKKPGVSKPSAAKAPSATDVAKGVQDFYERTKSYRAKFKQTYRAKVQNIKRVQKGKLAFAKPGKISFRYDKGNRVVSDGKIVKIYERDNKQMYRTKVSKSQYPAALSFLMGKGKLTRDFKLRLLDSKRLRVKNGWVLEAVPKEASPAYRKLLLYVDKATHQVRRVLVLDAQGNRNRFDFKSPQLNVKIPKKEFKFKPPKGTNIISP